MDSKNIDNMSATASPLFQRGTAKPGGMYPKTNTKSPYKRNPHSCWLRQRYTYPATAVAPLFKRGRCRHTACIPIHHSQHTPGPFRAKSFPIRTPMASTTQ